MKMMKIPLLSLAIWLLFVIFGLRHSLSQAHQEEEGLAAARGRSTESLQEGSLHGSFDTTGLRKMGIGRKTVAVHKMAKETAEDHEREDNSKISGSKKEISSDKFLERSQVYDQETVNLLNSKMFKSVNMGASKSEAADDDHGQYTTNKSKNSQYSKAKWTKFSSKRPSRTSSAGNDETQKLLKAAKEVANLMHKDYKDWAHRKPPINNRDPLH